MFTICTESGHEKIYFEKYSGKLREIRPCPLCHLHQMAEENEKEIMELKKYILELEKERRSHEDNRS